MAPELAVWGNGADLSLRNLHAVSFAPPVYSTALPRLSSQCLHRCHVQRLRTGLPFRRGSDCIGRVGYAQLTIAESGSGRSLDLWVLLVRFRNGASCRYKGGGSHGPQMDAPGRSFLGGAYWDRIRAG